MRIQDGVVEEVLIFRAEVDGVYCWLEEDSGGYRRNGETVVECSEGKSSRI